jgi:hypothetical protein
LEQRLEQGHPFTEPIPGHPAAELNFDPVTALLSLVIDHPSRRLPGIEPLELTLAVEARRDLPPRLRVGTRDRNLFRYFYDFCAEIIDKTRSAQVDVAVAIDGVWGAWVQLLDRDAVLSQEKQVGLLGELWLLDRLASRHGWAIALTQWHSTANAEHDFALAHLDIEVKSTTSKARVHVIGSPSQLEPAAGRPLFLLSTQLTKAPPLAEGSFSLAGEVSRLAASIPDLELRGRFHERLRSIDYRSEHERHYGETYCHRSAPVLIEVNDSFPRITNAHLSPLPGNLAARLRELIYRVDVSGLGYPEPSPQFQTVLPSATNGTRV